MWKPPPSQLNEQPEPTDNEKFYLDYVSKYYLFNLNDYNVKEASLYDTEKDATLKEIIDSANDETLNEFVKLAKMTIEQFDKVQIQLDKLSAPVYSMKRLLRKLGKD